MPKPKPKKKPTKSPGRKRPAPVSPKPRSAAGPVLALLSRNILFSGVNPKIIRSVVAGAHVRRFAAGDIIFDESSRGREMYCLTRGRVRINKYTKFGVESLLGVLHEGDFFGELSVVDGMPRSARAEAMDECSAVLLSQQEIRRLTKESNEFTFNLLTNMAVRLRTMDQTFIDRKSVV